MDGFKNNVNNFKGVMLCTRPNENIAVTKEKPFISRVDPKDNLGINPVKKVQTHVSVKKRNPVLQRHRQWLEEFKHKIQEKKMNEELKDKQDREKFEKVREQASYQRDTDNENTGELKVIANSPNKKEENKKQTSPQEQVSPPTNHKEEKHAAQKKKKENKEKPKWAYTEQQVKDEEEEEADDLLEFTNNLDYDKYIDDLEVKHMVTALKKRIDEIRSKEEENWKNKIVDAWNKDDGRKSVQPSKVDIDLDARSDARSCASENKSVASERTQNSISELKAKLQAKEKKEWETMSSTTKKNAVSLEERIAKHVADEVLRNNTEFRHFHSNTSVRKILEKAAQQHIEETRGIRPPEIANNKEYFMRKDGVDPNNLPYLHRNPAI